MVKATAFAAAALLAGAVMAEGGIESSSICGYINKAEIGGKALVPGDANMAAPCFIKVGTEGDAAYITLADIAVAGYTKIEDEGDGCESGMFITMLGANGATKKAVGLDNEIHDVVYTWNDVGEDLPMAWYDEAVNPMVSKSQAEEWGFEQSYWGDAKDIKFAPGDGFRCTEHSSFSGLAIHFPSPIKK